MKRLSLIALSLCFLLFSVSCGRSSNPLAWNIEELRLLCEYTVGGSAYEVELSMPKGNAAVGDVRILSPTAAKELLYRQTADGCFVLLGERTVALSETPLPLRLLSLVRPPSPVLRSVSEENGVRTAELLSDGDVLRYLYRSGEALPYEIQRDGADGFLSLRILSQP